MSFPPNLVRQYLSQFNVREDELVLDPFCGTGTTLVECKKRGVPSFGIESNPIAHFATKVKLDWSPDPANLARRAEANASNACRQIAADKVSRSKLKELPPTTRDLLLANSISPLPLHKILILLDAIDHNGDKTLSDHQRLAIAKVLVSGAGNLRFGPEVGLGRVKKDAPVVENWLHEVKQMSDDVRVLKGRNNIRSTAILGDARILTGHLRRRSVAAVITSPPYPNEKDYTRITRLESVILGFAKDMNDLRAVKWSSIRSHTRCVYKNDRDDIMVESQEDVSRISKEIEKRRVRLDKTSGFERLYARVTKLYFGGMFRHLSELRPLLRPDAKLAYVVGDQASYLRVMIRTAKILAKIATSLGYEVVGINTFRTRFSTATREHLNEEVLLLRWPGHLRKRKET